jgi:arsenate reductase
MKKAIIYNNSKCSTCRNTLAILQENKYDIDIIDYLEKTPSVDELRQLASYLGGKPKDMLRTKEDAFKKLNLYIEDDEAVLKAMNENPIIIQRPIVVIDKKAAISRPPETVLDLINR